MNMPFSDQVQFISGSKILTLNSLKVNSEMGFNQRAKYFRDLFIEILSVSITLSLSLLKSQCKEGAKYVNVNLL